MTDAMVKPLAAADRRMPDPWAAFSAALERTLAGMADGQFLILTARGSGRCVQFSAQGADGLRAEVVSNHYLPGPDQLDDDQVARLLADGWQPPTGTPEEATPERDPSGSPNFFVDLPNPVDHGDLARRTIRTWMVLGVEAPKALVYDAFAGRGGSLHFPELGLERARGDEDEADTVEARLLAVVRATTGLPRLEPDEDGDVPVRYGTVLAFLRMLQDPQRVCLFAPLLSDVRSRPALLERLNELNVGSSPVRFLVRGSTVFGYAEIPAEPLVAAHVESVLHAFCARCDGVGPWLARRFGGEVVPGSETASPTLH
jgi:hypothetical protein